LKFPGRGANACSRPIKDVPKEEQDCVKYDKNGLCEQRGEPPLNGENITSVKIAGDYLVLFVYFAQGDSPNGPWTSCQSFPIAIDVNNDGPRQMKWQNIRNYKGFVPNYVVIIPIQ